MRLLLLTVSPGEYAYAASLIIVALGSAAAAFVAAKSGKATKALGEETQATVEAVHQTVNGNQDELQERIVQLEKALQKAGVEIPEIARSVESKL